MTSTPAQPRVYSHVDRIRSAGILGLSFAGTIVLFGGLIASIITLMVSNLWAALAVFAPVAAALWVTSRKDQHGRSLSQKALTRMGFASAYRAGRTRYRSGTVGAIASGRNELPGLAAASTMSEFRDSWERPFGLIHHPHPGHVVLGFAVSPEGGALVDNHQIDSWVRGLDEALRSFTVEPDVMACQIIVEAAPGTGAKLHRLVQTSVDPNAHAVPRQALDELLQLLASGAVVLQAFVTITFTTRTAEGGKRSVLQMGQDLSARVPFFAEILGITGAGQVRPLSAQEWCEVIRVGYDPAAQTAIEAAHHDGQTPDLSWSDVGPVAADAEWAHYRHDSAVSVTWQMTGMPQGMWTATVLAPLLAPHARIARKRVTLLYRPIEVAVQNTVAVADRKTGGFLSSGGAQDAVALENAKRREEAVAQGAGLVNFGMLITATLTDESQIPDAAVAIEGMAGAARVQTRIATGMQDTAFAAALPLGIVLPLHRAIGKATAQRRGR